MSNFIDMITMDAYMNPELIASKDDITYDTVIKHRKVQSDENQYVNQINRRWSRLKKRSRDFACTRKVQSGRHISQYIDSGRMGKKHSEQKQLRRYLCNYFDDMEDATENRY